MARSPQQRKKIHYPTGSISHGTMRNEDLIPAFCAELEYLAKRKDTGVPAKVRKAHLALCAEIEAELETADSASWYFDSDGVDHDLEGLFDALDCYAGPYFYFGAHPGDGSDYGFWLSESWDEDFEDVATVTRDEMPCSIKVNDSADIPAWFRGEVAVFTDHGNVTLYVKTSRGMREIWGVV